MHLKNHNAICYRIAGVDRSTADAIKIQLHISNISKKPEKDQKGNFSEKMLLRVIQISIIK